LQNGDYLLLIAASTPGANDGGSITLKGVNPEMLDQILYWGDYGL
jgi:hypothetical protein